VLIHSDTRVIVTWEIPDDADHWHDPEHKKTLKIGVRLWPGVYGVCPEPSQTKRVYPDGLQEVFDWPNVGIMESQPWAARASVLGTTCKINGVTYNVDWRNQRARGFCDTRASTVSSWRGTASNGSE